MRYPFEATQAELETEIDAYIDSVFSCLESEFLIMPKGQGFVEYPAFELAVVYDLQGHTSIMVNRECCGSTPTNIYMRRGR